jgi:hypothetical protein
VNNLIIQVALAVIPIVLAITLHEAAHGYAALAMGDDTAKKAGRLSLNPLAHVDRVGTVLLPGFLLIAQLLTFHRVMFMFGWAKPVPVAAWRFRHPRQGMMVVAAAGPAMNFFLAWLGALLAYGLGYLPDGTAELGAQFIEDFGIVIVLLVIFLLPRMLADFGIAFDPFSALLNTVLPGALRLILMLAGHPVGPNDAQLL